MLLDFALVRPADEWCTTEQEKVTLCTNHFGIPVEQLPHRLYATKNSPGPVTPRYFMDKLPFFLAGRPQALHLVFLAAGSSVQARARFLHEHSGILTRVPRWAVVLVGPRGTVDEPAYQGEFRAFLAAPPHRRSTSAAELRWYFETRRAIELDKNPALSLKLIQRYQTARQRYTGVNFESLYRDWSCRGDSALGAPVGTSQPLSRAAGKLLMHELPFAYEQFGTLPGVA